MEATTESTSLESTSKPKPATSATTYIMVLLMGVYLGILFTKSEVAHWQRVHDMFLFREAHMYLIIATAIIVAMISMLLIKRFSIKSIEGKPITYKPKPYHTTIAANAAICVPTNREDASNDLGRLRSFI